MAATKKTILIKITGEAFGIPDASPETPLIHDIVRQIIQLGATHRIGIVVGGGNFFRGNQESLRRGITAPTGHSVGMLATMMNGLILADIFAQQGQQTSVLNAIFCPTVGETISQQAINQAFAHNNIIIFTGGTGMPFFTNDTNAIVRALQLDASEVWKATHVDGVCTANPRTNPHAHLLHTITHQEALTSQLKIMDTTAFSLAAEHYLTIRVFNVYHKNALLDAAHNADFGSVISTQKT